GEDPQCERLLPVKKVTRAFAQSLQPSARSRVVGVPLADAERPVQAAEQLRRRVRTGGGTKLGERLCLCCVSALEPVGERKPVESAVLEQPALLVLQARRLVEVR